MESCDYTENDLMEDYKSKAMPPVPVSQLSFDSRMDRVNQPKELAEQRAEKLRQREVIRENEIRHNKIKSFYKKRGVRYENCTLDNYNASDRKQQECIAQLRDYCSELQKNIEEGTNIILFGPKGTGKDHMLCALATCALQIGRDVVWENGLDLYGDVRDAIANGESERSLVKRLTESDVLYLSDPLSVHGALSQHQANMLFRVIEKRYSHKRSIWVTLNVSGAAELDDRISPQNGDRLRHDALAIYCNWPTFRTVKK